MQTIFPNVREKPLQLLNRCGGFYSCPKDANGRRLGPLAGYAGKYDDENEPPDSKQRKKQYVGDVYANFAMLERHAPALKYVARQLFDTLLTEKFVLIARDSTGFCGAPEGGKRLAGELSSLANKQFIFPEKRVTAVATATEREKSVIEFDRHAVHKGDFWWLVEDICNNFSTTDTLISLIESQGGTVAGIMCFFDRSDRAERGSFTAKSGTTYPVISLIDRRTKQYEQDDPFVAEDIKNGNVVWKPKDEWEPFEQAIAEYPEIIQAEIDRY